MNDLDLLNKSIACQSGRRRLRGIVAERAFHFRINHLDIAASEGFIHPFLLQHHLDCEEYA